jgi:LysR family transcriptional regulator for bpeEF and oprC
MVFGSCMAVLLFLSTTNVYSFFRDDNHVAWNNSRASGSLIMATAETLIDLPVFVRVAETCSFSQAARDLGLTASAASKAVARLEERLGVRLLHRTTRRVSVTEDGAAFMERCRRALSDLDEAQAALVDVRARPTGTLRVSLPSALGRLVIVPRLPELVQKHPGLSVDVDLSDRTVDVVGETFDAAVRIGNVEDERLIARRLARAQILVCASPDYLERRGKPSSPAELASHNVYLISHGRSGAQEWVFQRGAEIARVNVTGDLSFSTGEALVDAALAGDGIIGIFDFIASHALRSRQLVRLLGDWETPEGPPISVVYPRHRHLSPRVRAFVDFVASIVPEALDPAPHEGRSNG